MSTQELWLPDKSSPPQVPPEVVGSIGNLITENGTIEVAKSAAQQLENDQEEIQSYLDAYGFQLNSETSEGFWAHPALKIGASIAYLSYSQIYSLNDLGIGATFDTSRDIADLYGVPDTFISSLYDDTGLQSIIMTALKSRDLNQECGTGIEQIATIGAGCVRFFVHEALLNN